MTNSPIPETTAERWFRRILGSLLAGVAGFAPLPYEITWYGRLALVVLFLSLAFSTVMGIVLKNFAQFGPRIISAMRGNVSGMDRRNGVDAPGDGTRVQPALKRRKKDK